MNSSCKCGCGQTVGLDSRGRKRFYIFGHVRRGTKLSKGQKFRMSEYNKINGIKPPSRKGIKLSPKEIERITLFMRHNNPNKGKKFTEERKKRMSELSKKLGLRPPSRLGCKPWNKGLKGFRAGEKSHLWKGGKQSLKNKIRSLFEYRQWRSDILTRDNYTCNFCGKIGGELNVDHIKPFYLIIDENQIKSVEQAVLCSEVWSLNNGRVLCKSCHKTTDTYLCGHKIHGKQK